MKKLAYILLFSLSALAVACNENKVITTLPAPEIIVENGGVYSTKQGIAITLQPRVESSEEALFSWYREGVKVGSEPSYTLCEEEAGSYYVMLRVENASGKDEEEFRIEVLELRPPKISFLTKNGVIEAVVGVATRIVPQVSAGDEAKYEWWLNDEPLAGDAACEVTLQAEGDNTLRLAVENKDGRAERSITLRGVHHLTGSVGFPAPAGLGYTSVKYMSRGRSIVLAPTTEAFAEPSFEWSVAGEVISQSPQLRLAVEKDCEVELTVSDADGYTLTSTLTIVCCEAEGAYRREADAQSSRRWSKVYEYMPAAGQFIGEDKSGFSGAEHSTADAAAYAEKRLSEGKFLSLGGFGGYVVLGFDHSIANKEGADITIYGNMYATSSEAGIVWVMQDSNGNGEPDDEWYELRGSEWGGQNHTTRYAVTYFRTEGERMPIRWRDNRGGEGEVPYMAAHRQPSYFPQWVEGDHYTLYGSLLATNTTTLPSGVVSHNAYAWGYADNLGSDSEGSSTDDNDAVACHLDIANAVTADGLAAELQYIDFVRIQSALNGCDSSMGELSTEVLGVEER